MFSGSPKGLRYRNRHIVHEPVSPKRHRSKGAKADKGGRGQQSSVSRRVGTPASQAGAACVPSSQLPTAQGRLTTVHRSRERFSSTSFSTSLLNTSPRSA